MLFVAVFYLNSNQIKTTLEALPSFIGYFEPFLFSFRTFAKWHPELRFACENARMIT
jgi:hypothetical protein